MRPRIDVIQRARVLATLPKIRLGQLAEVLLEDPVLVLELFNRANRLANRVVAPLVAIDSAIIRLGEEGLSALWSDMERQHSKFGLVDDELFWYEVRIERSRRIGIVAQYLAEAVKAASPQKLMIGAAFASLGDALAVMHLGRKYTALADEQDASPSKMNYHLIHDHKFNPEVVVVRYLEQRGILPALNIMLDHKVSKIEDNRRGEARLVTSAAREIVLAFEDNNWEIFSPDETLPSRSSVRLLRFSTPKSYAAAFNKIHLFFLEIKRKRMEPG